MVVCKVAGREIKMTYREQSSQPRHDAWEFVTDNQLTDVFQRLETTIATGQTTDSETVEADRLHDTLLNAYDTMYADLRVAEAMADCRAEGVPDLDCIQDYFATHYPDHPLFGPTAIEERFMRLSHGHAGHNPMEVHGLLPIDQQRLVELTPYFDELTNQIQKHARTQGQSQAA
jgi:hypothetical protein